MKTLYQTLEDNKDKVYRLEKYINGYLKFHAERAWEVDYLLLDTRADASMMLLTFEFDTDYSISQLNDTKAIYAVYEDCEIAYIKGL
jgi:hypothetical protein